MRTEHILREQAAGRSTRRLGTALVWMLTAWVAFLIASDLGTSLVFILAFGPGFLLVVAFAVGVVLRHHGDALLRGEDHRGGPALAWSTIVAAFYSFPALYFARWFSTDRGTHIAPLVVSQVMCGVLALLALGAITRLLLAGMRRWPWFAFMAAALAVDVILLRRPGSENGYGTVLIVVGITTATFWALKLIQFRSIAAEGPRAQTAKDPLADSVMHYGYGSLLIIVIAFVLPAWQTPHSTPWLLLAALPIAAALGLESIRRAARWRLANQSSLEGARPVKRALLAGVAGAAISGFFLFSYLFSLAR